MFGSGRKQAVRELEQEQVRLREKLENFTQAAEQIESSTDKAIDMVDTLFEEQNSFDGALTHVVENIKQLQGMELQRTNQESQLHSRMEQMAEGLGSGEQLYHELLSEVRGREADLVAMAEQNKHFTNPTRFINQSVKALEEDVSRIEVRLGEMKEFGHQMGVLSLNAAIEAGRMGESGRKFVAAAEEVRGCAGKYQDETVRLMEELALVKQKLLESQEQVEHLTGLLKDNSVMLGKTLRAFQGCSSRMEEGNQLLQTRECQEILQEWQQMGTFCEARERHFEQALLSMERAGESFMKEQQSMEQIKDELNRIQLENNRHRTK